MLPNPEMDVVVRAYRAMVTAPPDVRLDDGAGACCPVDDTVLLQELHGWCCPTCLAWWDRRGRAGVWLADDRDLAAAVVAEDALETAGMLDAGHRQTCPACRTWANPAHLHSCAYWAALDRNVVDGQLVAGRVLEDGDQAAQRLRRLDRRCAVLVAAVAAMGFGLGAGRVLRPWAHLVPDELVWAAVAGVVAAGAVTLAGVALWRWWRGWRPYRHNRIHGSMAELGWDVPAEGGVPDGR